MRRTLFLVGGAAAVVASYTAVIFGLAPEPGFGPTTLASIALPALVSGLVMTLYIAFETKRSRETSGVVSELNAQLARKEVEISRLASVDELTGLFTRRHFDDTIALEYKRTLRHGRPLSLLLVEIDDLAELGEHIGAMSKGYLLSEIGSLLRTMLRINDMGCRYSSEVLAVLLPETDADQARAIAEKVRTLVSERMFLGRQQDGVQLTVSQGISAVPAGDATSHLDLLKAAEKALAEARLTGYDQIQVIHPKPVLAEQTPQRRSA